MLPFLIVVSGWVRPFFQDSTKPDLRDSNFVCFWAIDSDIDFEPFRILFGDWRGYVFLDQNVDHPV